MIKWQLNNAARQEGVHLVFAVLKIQVWSFANLDQDES